MIKLLKSGWTVAVLGAALYVAVTLALVRPAKILAARERGPAGGKQKTQGFTWQADFSELDQLMGDLRKEKEDLAARKQQLDELAARLQTERKELTEATQAVMLQQKEFDQNVVRVREEEVANLKKMAKVYAAMTPEGAASIFKSMEDSQVVKYLVFMREGETAPILEGLAKGTDADSKRAALISERLRTATYRNATVKNTTP